MTVNKNDVITIPKWLVIIILPMLVAGVTSFGFYKANTAKQEEKLNSTEKQLIRIDDSKVSKAEFGMLKDQLGRIEDKLDKHMTKP